MEPLLQGEAIGRGLPGGGWLLKDLSVEIRPGDRIAIQGPAGAGKTLLLRALALLDPLDAGEIRWRGKSVPDQEIPSFRRQVGYLHQSPALVEGTAEANLRLPFTLGVYRDRTFDPGRALELLRHLGCDRSFLTRSCADLSGGESQMVALVRLLQLDPVVLLLDEPTASLDPEATRRATDLITSWAESGASERATVWVSHDQQLTRKISSRRLRLERGILLAEG
ncbi:MAG: ATP-binding cassette domain-containing protein [Thermoanaerobaculia bacterium]